MNQVVSKAFVRDFTLPFTNVVLANSHLLSFRQLKTYCEVADTNFVQAIANMVMVLSLGASATKHDFHAAFLAMSANFRTSAAKSTTDTTTANEVSNDLIVVSARSVLVKDMPSSVFRSASVIHVFSLVAGNVVTKNSKALEPGYTFSKELVHFHINHGSTTPFIILCLDSSTTKDDCFVLRN